MTQFYINASLLKSHFEHNVWSRGRELYLSDHVVKITRDFSNTERVTYRGLVTSSDGNAKYRVTLFIELSQSQVISRCSCPYAFQCKHGAAILHKLLTENASNDAQKPNQNIDEWLNNFASTPDEHVATEPKRWWLFYLLDLEDEQKVGISVVERYKKKNGEWGRVRYLSSTELLNVKVDANERSLIDIISKYSSQSGYHYVAEKSKFKYALGATVVQLAMKTGRALNPATMMPWSLGDELNLHLGWQETKDSFIPRYELDELEPDTVKIINTSPMVYVDQHTVGFIRGDIDGEQWSQLRTLPEVPKERMSDLYSLLRKNTPRIARAIPEQYHAEVITQLELRILLLANHSKSEGWLPGLKLFADYGDTSFELLQDASSSTDTDSTEFVKNEAGKLVEIRRDLTCEKAAVDLLVLHQLFQYNYTHQTGWLWVPNTVGAERHIVLWNKLLPTLEALFKEHGWLVELDDSYQFKESKLLASATFADSETGWFDTQLTLSIDGVATDTANIVEKWLAAGGPEQMPVMDQQGHWHITDTSQLQPIYHILLELYSSGRNQDLHLPAFKAISLAQLDDSDFKQAPTLKKLHTGLKNFRGLKPLALPKTVKADLRDYQKQGLSWLYFLYKYGFGGILADDMGLGKTLQTLSFLQKLKSSRKLSDGALIVAPTSVLWNWQSEAQKFCPNLRSLVLHGNQRWEYFDELDNHDLIITSYSLLQRDIEFFESRHFNLVILDEAQYIKNSATKSARAAKRIDADMRLCLTGTPLENHLGELWSLMDFALPGLLGSQENFKRIYRTPIEKNNDERANIALANRVAPFMLRRTKNEVVKELPQKTTITQVVQLASSQMKLYESIRISMEKRIRQLIKQKGVARSHIEFLDALLKLRQACIDPRLVNLKQARSVKGAAKMDWLLQTLPELVSEGRKILVFSQFTKMLDLIKKELIKLDIKHEILTGRTTKRKEAIAQFQQGDAHVFLISLKAGGTGLNLTAADTVIHVDPWWNPAVENQATDRAHRIGQENPVFVYKLVAENTVEEKIQAMQNDKQAVADALFSGTKGAGLAKSGAELISLLSANDAIETG